MLPNNRRCYGIANVLRQTKIQNNNFIFWISFIYLLISVGTPAELPPRVFNN